MGYAGDITSNEAWEILEAEPRAVLVDVRSEAEWRFVGVPDLRSLDKETVRVSWQTYPDAQPNPSFATELRAKGVDSGGTVLLLCRSGNRSRFAAIALAALGFRRCYNVADGFEGPLDEDGRRGTRAGWKVAGLPWVQT